MRRKVAPASEAKNARKLFVSNKKQVAERAAGPRATRRQKKHKLNCEGRGGKSSKKYQSQRPFSFEIHQQQQNKKKNPQRNQSKNTQHSSQPRRTFCVLHFRTSPPFFTQFLISTTPVAMALARSASVPGGLSINTGAANLL